jgi:CheY-like chemotaxis protein
MVDDDRSYLEAASRYLEQCGQTVEGVTDGRNAMQIVLAAVPDLVILDLMLPGIDGCSLIEIIRSYLRLQRLPIIVLSSLVSGPLVDRARELRVNNILDKGRTTLARLAEIVQEQLQNGWG